MKIQDIPETAVRGARTVVTLPVHLARHAAGQLRGQDAKPSAKPSSTPTDAEAPAVVAEETDGVAAARHAAKS
jgi:hypothetical protein